MFKSQIKQEYTGTLLDQALWRGLSNRKILGMLKAILQGKNHYPKVAWWYMLIITVLSEPEAGGWQI